MSGTVIQTAFKFDSDLTSSMKHRAKALGMSVNRYVRSLIEKDIIESELLPKISFDNLHDDDIERLSGILKEPDVEKINSDPRASAIWNR